MSYTCPVCKTNYERQQDCGICGFSERPRLFLSKSQARNWFETEVLPRRRKYENSLRKPVVVEKPPIETEKSSFEEREFGNSFPNRTHSRREEYSWRDDLPKASRDKNSAIIEPKEITIEVGQIGHFNVRDALNKDSFWTTHLIWSSSDERVATVKETLSGNASVTAVSAGTTTITGKSIDGGYNNVSGKVTVLPHRLSTTIVSDIIDDYIPSLFFALLGVFPLYAKSIIETSTAFLLVLGLSIAFTILMRFLKSLRVNFFVGVGIMIAIVIVSFIISVPYNSSGKRKDDVYSPVDEIRNDLREEIRKQELRYQLQKEIEEHLREQELSTNSRITRPVVSSNNAIPVTGISIRKDEETIAVGDMRLLGLLLRVDITPSNASNQHVIWQSSNPRIANISDGGLIEGVSAGRAIITGITEDGGYSVRGTVTVINLRSD